MLTCHKDTVLPIDDRVLQSVKDGYELQLDQAFERLLPDIHGGIPETPYFTTRSGIVRRVGWFITCYDFDSELPGEFQNACYYSNHDERVDDRSLWALLGDLTSPFFGGERVFPFAALWSPESGFPSTLHFYSLDSYPDDALCFDISTAPHSVVLWKGRHATDELMKFEDGECDEPDYSAFTEQVAGSFSEFVGMLRAEP